MKFNSNNQVFVSKKQVMYLQVKNLPNKRMAGEYSEEYDDFFVRTSRLKLPSFLAPQTLIEVLKEADHSSWILTALGDKLTKAESECLQSKAYQSFLLYQPPIGSPWIAWALANDPQSFAP